MRSAVQLSRFVFRALRSFQSVSQILMLGCQPGYGRLQALAVGLQVRDGFNLVVDQKLRFYDVPIQLEHVLPQEVRGPLDALRVVLDNSQQNAILEVQGPEAG